VTDLTGSEKKARLDLFDYIELFDNAIQPCAHIGRLSLIELEERCFNRRQSVSKAWGASPSRLTKPP